MTVERALAALRGLGVLPARERDGILNSRISCAGAGTPRIPCIGPPVSPGAIASFGLVRRLQNRPAWKRQSPRKMLVATDFSEGSDEAIDRAIEMAKQSSAEVEIIHVIELAEEFPFGTTYFDADYGVLYASVDLHLSRRADRFRQAGLACETKIVEGSASTEIATRGRDIGADLIVVGTHGRTRPRACDAGQRRRARGQARLLPGPDRPLLAKGGVAMDTATAADNKIDPALVRTSGPGAKEPRESWRARDASWSSTTRSTRATR